MTARVCRRDDGSIVVEQKTIVAIARLKILIAESLVECARIAPRQVQADRSSRRVGAATARQVRLTSFAKAPAVKKAGTADGQGDRHTMRRDDLSASRTCPYSGPPRRSAIARRRVSSGRQADRSSCRVGTGRFEAGHHVLPTA